MKSSFGINRGGVRVCIPLNTWTTRSFDLHCSVKINLFFVFFVLLCCRLDRIEVRLFALCSLLVLFQSNWLWFSLFQFALYFSRIHLHGRCMLLES